MNKKCFYVIERFRSVRDRIPLNLTGRWKLTFDPGFKDPILYLEHQGKFFKKWVPEVDIIEGYERKEYTNKCESNLCRFGQRHLFSYDSITDKSIFTIDIHNE